MDASRTVEQITKYRRNSQGYVGIPYPQIEIPKTWKDLAV